MMKRLTSILIMALFISSFYIGYAEDTKTTASYFKSIEMGEELDFLRALQIVKDEDLAVDATKTMTRAEFAKVACRAIDQEETALNANYTQIYNDVPTSHKAFSQIAHMSNLGYFNGNANGSFEPDREVSMNEAVKIAVTLLGYHNIMDKSQGYPGAYLSIAGSKGLLKNVLTNGKAARRVDIYMLMYNTINTDIVKITSYSEEYSYEIQKNNNILAEYWELVKETGIVLADNFVSIDGEKTIPQGAINIDGKLYNSATPQTADKIGRKTEFYYKVDENLNLKTIYYIKTKIANAVTLTADLIDSFDYQSGIYTILENGKEKKFSIGNKYLLSYNGDAIVGSDMAKMNPRCGTITLIDNDDNNTYDVVMVEEYYNLVVDRYDKTANFIYDKFGRHIRLDDYIEIGAEFDLLKLQENNIISVFVGSESVKMQLSTDKAFGTIDEISIEGNETIITVSSQDYKKSLDLNKDITTIRVGEEYTFFIDYFGNIAYFELDTEMDYGYILKFSEHQNALKQREVQIVDAMGQLSVIKLANKISVTSKTGVDSYTSSNIHTILTDDRFVLFSKNKDKEISKIVLPYIVTDEREYYDLPDYPLYRMDYFIDKWPNVVTTYEAEYRQEIKGFGNWLIMDEQTSIFEVPLLLNQERYLADEVNVIGIGGIADKTKLRVNRNIANIGKTQGVENEFLVYKIGNKTIAPNILVNHKSVTKSVVVDSYPYLISKIVKVYDEKLGADTYKLTLMKDANTTEIVLADPRSNTRENLSAQEFGGLPTLHPNKQSLAIGDIIKYSTNKDGQIDSIRLMYDGQNDEIGYSSKLAFDGLFRLVDGEVYRIKGNFIEMRKKDGIMERTNLSGVKVLVCDLDSNEKVKSGTVADISPTDTVCIYSRYIVNRLIVVYK